MRNALALLALPLLVAASGCTNSGSGSGTSGSGNGSPSEPAGPASAAAVAPAAAPAKVIPPPFEGTLSVHMIGGKKDVEVSVTAKGGKLRVDFPGAKGQTEHTLYDQTTKQLTVLSDARKSATTVTAASAAATPFRSTNKTALHELIAGRDCEGWDAVDVSGKHETLCVTDGFENLDLNAIFPPDAGYPTFGSWLKDVREQHQFPLRAVITDTSGAIESHWEISKIDPHSIDDSVFTAPATYTNR